MISFILIALAAICNAMMDTLAHHYDTSVFKKLNPAFWNPLVSSEKAKRIFNYKLDAWHLLKSLMIVLVSLAIICYGPLYLIFPDGWIRKVFDFLFIGLIWNVSFNLFYNRILRRK